MTLTTLTPKALYYLNYTDPPSVPAEVTAATQFQVKVVEPYEDVATSTGTFTGSQVTSMKSSTDVLLAYFSIGEAENFRWYWTELDAAAKGPEDPEWPGDFEVAYWTTEWRTLCETEVAKYVALGYDGVYFDVVDEYLNAWAEANVVGGTAEFEMVDLITHLAAYARGINSSFQVWVNNAEELYAGNPTYVAAIDGCYRENLFYQDNGTIQPSDETSFALDSLQPMLDANKPICCIEYVVGTSSESTKVADVIAKAALYGLGYYVGVLDLDRISTEGVGDPTPDSPPDSPPNSPANSPDSPVNSPPDSPPSGLVQTLMIVVAG